MTRPCAMLRHKSAGCSRCRKSSSESLVSFVFYEPRCALLMLNQLTISDLQKRLIARETTAREAVHVCLDQIKRVDGSVKAFLSYDEADALSQADAVDKLIAGGATTAQY